MMSRIPIRMAARAISAMVTPAMPPARPDDQDAAESDGAACDALPGGLVLVMDRPGVALELVRRQVAELGESPGFRAIDAAGDLGGGDGVGVSHGSIIGRTARGRNCVVARTCS